MPPLFNKLKSYYLRFDFQLIFLVTAIVLMSNAILSIYSISREITRSTHNMQQQAQILATNVALTSASYLIVNDYAELENILLRAARFDGVEDVLLTDAKGTVLGKAQQSDEQKVAVVFNTENLVVPKNNMMIVITETDHLIAWEPINYGSLLGWVRVKYSLKQIVETKRQILTKGLGNSIIMALITLFIIYIFIRRPMNTLVRYTYFARGLQNNIGQKLYVDTGNIEFIELGTALNETSQNLQLAMNELEKLAAFPECNPNIVLSMNKDGKVQYFNPKGIEWLRRNKLSIGDLHKILPANYKTIINKSKVYNKTKQGIEVVCADYALIWTFAPVEGHDLIHAYAMDVTTLKNAEKKAYDAQFERVEAEAKSQTKSMFLANMSHEIRTPLTAIIGFTESLLTENLDQKQHKKIAETIIRNGKHLQQIINDILDLSKIEAGQLDIELLSISPFELIGEVDSLLGMKVREKGLDFNIKYHFPLPSRIESDITRLKQILINLCSNAIKFTDEGSVSIDISYDIATRMILFTITDTGSGMTAEEKVRVFNPFTQADSSTTRKFGGTGLGLPISNELSTALGGSLSCESKKGQGSCFTLSIATHCPDDALLIDALENVHIYHDDFLQTAIRQLSGHILLAEDNPDNQQLISMYIRKTGVAITIAENGRLAVEKALANKYDLILMDMQMPVMSGIEAITSLRSTGYTGPIVSLTANAMKSDRDECLKVGANGYLSKPIDLRRFYEVLNTHLPESKTNNNSEHMDDAKAEFLNNPKYKKLVNHFLQNLPQTIDTLSEAISAQDWDEVGAKSHDLKGMGGAMGFPEITEVAGRINTLVKQEEYIPAADTFEELEKLCHNIIEQN